MKSNFTPEEIEVLNEFVAKAKASGKDKFLITTVDDVRKQMMYNFNHGKGAAYVLLHKALPFLEGMYELTEKELNYLEKKAEIVAKYEVWHWEYVDELPEITPSYIAVRGEGYVILKTGIRLDYGFDYYRHEREEFAKTGVYDEGMR